MPTWAPVIMKRSIQIGRQMIIHLVRQVKVAKHLLESWKVELKQWVSMIKRNSSKHEYLEPNTLIPCERLISRIHSL